MVELVALCSTRGRDYNFNISSVYWTAFLLDSFFFGFEGDCFAITEMFKIKFKNPHIPPFFRPFRDSSGAALQD